VLVGFCAFGKEGKASPPRPGGLLLLGVAERDGWGVGRADAGAELSQDACVGFTRTGGAAGVDDLEEADRGGKERPPALEGFPPECGATAEP